MEVMGSLRSGRVERFCDVVECGCRHGNRRRRTMKRIMRRTRTMRATMPRGSDTTGWKRTAGSRA